MKVLSELRLAGSGAVALSLVPGVLLCWPSLTIIAKILGIVYPSIAAVIGFLADFRTGDPRRLTRAGSWALALGAATMLTNVGVMVAEGAREQQSATAAIRRQTQVIDNLRRLVAPLGDQLSASVSLSIPAEQRSVSEMATYLNKVRGKKRYAGLPPVLRSDSSRERAFAELVSLTTVYLYFCKDASCIDALARQKGDDPDHPRVLLSGQLMISRPELSQLGVPAFRVEVDTRRQMLSFDGEKQVFLVTLQDQAVRFDETEGGVHSADDLPGSTLVASVYLGGGTIKARFSLDAVVLRKKNGMFLQATTFADRSKIEGQSYQNFLVTKLDDRWR